MQIEFIVSFIAKCIELVGIVVICLGLLYSLWRFSFSRKSPGFKNYKSLRETMGKSILLGLEVLVAADIIGTVVTDPSLENVYVLGLIVVIRTFLSLSIQVELEGTLPWRKGSASA